MHSSSKSWDEVRLCEKKTCLNKKVTKPWIFQSLETTVIFHIYATHDIEYEE